MESYKALDEAITAGQGFHLTTESLLNLISSPVEDESSDGSFTTARSDEANADDEGSDGEKCESGGDVSDSEGG